MVIRNFVKDSYDINNYGYQKCNINKILHQLLKLFNELILEGYWHFQFFNPS